MTLYSYVVARDFGFAPNPFHGVCTLATCKPNIRRVAQVNDWVLGTGSKARKRQRRVVYAMRVTGVMSFEDYWNAPQFQIKKPNLLASKKYAFGDNIYHRNPSNGRWQQADSHHSLEDGSPNPANVKNDTQTNRILFSDDFVYWGGSGPDLPERFLDYGSEHATICAVRNHRSQFPAGMVGELVAWIRSLNQQGCLGEPLDWSKTP